MREGAFRARYEKRGEGTIGLLPYRSTPPPLPLTGQLASFPTHLSSLLMCYGVKAITIIYIHDVVMDTFDLYSGGLFMVFV